MRQGDVAGVTAPEAIILPDPARRFATTAARLETLSAGHPMEEWLRYMAWLSRAQDEAATGLAPFAQPSSQEVEQAIDAGLPPLAAEHHHRVPAWRDALAMMLDRLHDYAGPAQARAVISGLRSAGAPPLEALAGAFLAGSVDAAEAGSMLYIAAALQVYFTRLAADLPLSSLRLLRQRSLCPCCGSPPVAGVVTASGQASGLRYLHCSLCSTAWNHVRAVCITCGGSRGVSLKGIEDGTGAAKAETCDDCRTYTKLLYQIRDARVDAVADDLATLSLDLLLAEAGWLRHAPNPFLLVA